jgi:hypothetical protein
MKRVRKELEVEETNEKPLKEKVVRDYTDIARDLTEYVKENYLTDFEIGLFLWEENLKIISSQIEQWFTVQQQYTTLMRELGKFPTETVNFWIGNPKFINSQIGKIFALQKDYSTALMNTSDRFMKEALVLMKNGIERHFQFLTISMKPLYRWERSV